MWAYSAENLINVFLKDGFWFLVPIVDRVMAVKDDHARIPRAMNMLHLWPVGIKVTGGMKGANEPAAGLWEFTAAAIES